MSDELLNLGQNSILLTIINNMSKKQMPNKLKFRLGQSTIPEENKEYTDSKGFSSFKIASYKSKKNISQFMNECHNFSSCGDESSKCISSEG